MKKIILLTMAAAAVLVSCKTMDFEGIGTEASRERISKKEERKSYYDEMEEYLIQKKLDYIDAHKPMLVVEKPVYYPSDKIEPEKPGLKGKDAARKSTEESIQAPEKWTSGTMYYDFDPDFTYEIYCQPYRVTDLMLEPGEQVIEMPFLSEEKVWEIGAGVSRSNGIDTQHFFLKPAYSGLVTSFIIITDKRVYHMLLKSYKDCYMTQVKWDYPGTMPFTLNLGSATLSAGGNSGSTLKDRLSGNSAASGVDPAHLSFDYKMSFSKKVYWLPTRVYDDGKRTYIVMDETVLHMTSPILLNRRNERINYSVNKNVIVINELIEKVTLRIGKRKVVIRKKTYKEPKVPDENRMEKTVKRNGDSGAETEFIPPADKKNSFNSVYNSRLKKETLLHSDDIVVEPKNPVVESSETLASSSESVEGEN